MMSGLVRKTDYNAKIDGIKIKVTNITRLATTTELNDAKNKIPNIIILVKKNYDTKISDTEEKYFTISGYNKFTSEIVDKK